MTSRTDDRQGRGEAARARGWRWRLAAVLAALLPAACAYDPPMKADHGAPAYRTALADCQKSGNAKASRDVNAFAKLWFTYPVSYPLRQRREIESCMVGKGYAPG